MVVKNLCWKDWIDWCWSRSSNIIENLMEAPQYQEYLGLEGFEDYISLPQRFACDDIDATEKMVGEQLKNPSPKYF